MHHGLRKLAKGDLAFRNQHEDLKPRPPTIGRRRRGGIAGGRADDRTRAFLHCLRNGKCHTSVLERTRRVCAFKFQIEVKLRRDCLRQPGRPHERRIALSKRYNRCGGRHRQEPPVLLDNPPPRRHLSILSLNAHDGRRGRHRRQRINFLQGRANIPFNRCMRRHHDRDRLAVLPAALQNRGDADVMCAEDARQAGKNAGAIEDHKTEVIQAGDLLDRPDAQRPPLINLKT